MAELVEDGFDLAVGEQRRLAAHRRVEVAAHQPEVRLETAVIMKSKQGKNYPAAEVIAYGTAVRTSPAGSL